MPTRILQKRWGALCIGMLLMSLTASSAPAGHWWKLTSNSTSDQSQEGTPAPAAADTSSTSTTAPSSNGGFVDCPPGYASGARVCRFCRGRGCGYCRHCYVPVNGYGYGGYCDPRDRLLYSAQGYNVPVTVPLAPVCRTCNYGWGVPSTRLTRAGSYSAWYPDVAFTQRGGRLPGGLYPVVYQPTDTTQFGFYYQYVPTWVAPR